jgi:hypothetical protein
MSDDDADRQRILDRANRMVGQSKLLRKMAEELRQESDDLRRSVRRRPKKADVGKKR